MNSEQNLAGMGSVVDLLWNAEDEFAPMVAVCPIKNLRQGSGGGQGNGFPPLPPGAIGEIIRFVSPSHSCAAPWGP